MFIQYFFSLFSNKAKIELSFLKSMWLATAESRKIDREMMQKVWFIFKYTIQLLWIN